MREFLISQPIDLLSIAQAFFNLLDLRYLQLSARWPVLHIATIREPEIDQRTDTGTNT